MPIGHYDTNRFPIHKGTLGGFKTCDAYQVIIILSGVPHYDTHCTPKRQLVLRMAVTPKFLRKCRPSSLVAILGLVNSRQAEKVKCLPRTRKTLTLAELQMVFSPVQYVDFTQIRRGITT